MIWHKETLISLGGFDVELGIKGYKLSVGEETMAFRRLWETHDKPNVLYDPALIVFHWVPDFKMKVSYYLKRAFIAGQVAIRLDSISGIRWRIRTAVRSFGAGTMYFFRAVLRFTHYRHWQNWCVEECLPIATKLGTTLAIFGITMNARQK